VCVRRPTIRQEFSSAQIEGVRLQPKRSSAGICRSHLGLAHFIRVVKMLSYCIILLCCRFFVENRFGVRQGRSSSHRCCSSFSPLEKPAGFHALYIPFRRSSNKAMLVAHDKIRKSHGKGAGLSRTRSPKYQGRSR
jgi:hypothetical protein